jgi:hypothetical protein
MAAVWACGPSQSTLPAAGTTSTSSGVGAGTGTGTDAGLPVELPRGLGKWSVSDTNAYWALCLIDHWFFTQNELRSKCICEGELLAGTRSFKEVKDSYTGGAFGKPTAAEKEGIAQCLAAALSEQSNHPDAQNAVDNWNRRQIDYEGDVCKSEVLDAHPSVEPVAAQGYCLCEKRSLAAKLGYLDYKLRRGGTIEALRAAEAGCKALRKW